MTPDLRVHEHWAVFDPNLLQPHEVLVISGAVTLESTHEMVQLGRWTVSNPAPFSDVCVSGPGLTSGITL
ncbi:hypothetical protein Tco_0747893 [Tanacetum coccineum]|uniref:Uncharacterized protein n=1 Tax=Tanacetum coccineum TaxID=301880 RepID=A0ABQ4YWS5_9ASTR